MRKQFLKSMLLALLCVVGGVTSAWAAGFTRTLTEKLEVTGYKIKQLYNFQNNTPAVLPTTGDMCYRDGDIWGLHNYKSGPRSATATIPVEEGDILIIQNYTGYTATINRGTENTALSTSTGYQCFDITTTANDVTFTVPRYGGIVAALVMEMDPVTATYDFEAGVNPFTDRSRITSAIEDNATLGSKVLGFTNAGNAQNGYSFSDFSLANLFIKASVAIFEFDYYVTKGGRPMLTIGDSSVRGTTGGNSNTTYNSTGAAFALGTNDRAFLVNGAYVSSSNNPIDNFVDKWLHVKVTIKPEQRTVAYTITDKSDNTVLASGNPGFYAEDAYNCNQIDLFGYINSSHCAMLDNISIKYIPGSVDYTVNGVDADGNVLYEVAKGTGVQLTNLKVPYSTYFNNNGALLKADKIDDTKKEYNYTFALDADPTVKTITYKATDITEGLVFLTEAEELEGVTIISTGNSAIRSSRSKSAYNANADTKITTLAPGKYKLTSVICDFNGKTASASFTYCAGTNEIFVHTAENINWDEQTSEEFIITENTDIILKAGGASKKGVDLIYIVKTGEASDDALLAAAKTALESLITDATALDAEGLAIAIGKANTALNDEDATVESLESAKTALQQAIDAWKASKMFMGETGKYYLKNVASGKFLGAGNSWGTQASLIAHPEYLTLNKLNDGKYNIDSQVSNGGNNHYFNGSFMDNNSPLALTIAKSGNYYTISGNIVDEQTKQTVLRYFGYDGQSTVLAALEESGDNALWQIFSEAEMLATLSTATADAPADATFLLLNPNFGRNNRHGHSLSTKDDHIKTADLDDAWTFDATNKDVGGDNTNYCVESYHVTFTLTQAVANAPEGVYALTAQGFYRQDGQDNNNLPYFYAKGVDDEATATFPLKTGSENSMNDASVSFSAGNYTIDPILFEVGENGTFEVGAKNQNTSLWCIWDNFELSYLGNSPEAYAKLNAKLIAQVEELKAEAQQRLDNEAVQGTEALTAAITAANGALQTADKADLKDAIAALKEAIAHDKAYIAAAEAIAKAKALKEAHNFATAEATATFADAIAAIETPFKAGTLSDADAQAAPATLGLTVTGHRAGANTAASNYLENGFQLNDFDAALYVNTWSTEGANDDSGFEVPFYEYYTDKDKSLGANTFTGTLTGLDNGLYSVKATVRVNVKNGVDDLTTATGITMQVNDGETVDVTKGTQVGTSRFLLKEYTAEGLVKDGNLSLTFNIAEGNNISWLSFQHVYYNKERDLTPEEEFKAATASDYAALTSAITTAEEKTLGFDAAEYAPYNNIDALNALATAKAIDQTVQNEQAAVQAATTALTNAQWNENAQELNAVFDGTFATATNDGPMTGWATDHNAGLGGAYHARAFVLNNGDNNYDNLAAFGQGKGTRSCAYMRFDGTNSAQNTIYTYGATMGYTMPLNADLYLLTAQLGGWGQVDKDVTLRIVDGNNEVVGTQTVHTVPTGINAGGKAVSLSLYFKPEVAGSYRLQVLNSSNADNAIAISNILLMTAPYNPTALNNSISEATALSSKMDEGEAKTALNNAIATAQAAIEAAQNQNDIDNADNALQQAISTAQAAYDLAEAKKLLNDKIQAVKTYTLPEIATTLYNSELTTVSNDLVAATTTEEVANLNNTFDNLNKTAEGIETKYMQYKDDVKNINTMLASEAIEYNDEAKTTLQNKLSNWDRVIENGEGYQSITTLEYYAAIANKFWSLPMEDGIREFVANVKVKKNEELDITLLLTNPDVSSFWTGAWYVRPEGWYNEQNGGNFQVMANNDMGPDGEVFMEYWSEKAATSGFVLAQKVYLPEGTYKMTGRVGVQQFDGNGTTTNVTFSANDIDGTQIPYGPLVDGEIEFVQPQMGKVTIGLKAHEGNNARWMGINKIKLYKTNNTKTITLSETVTYDATQTGVADVTLNRNIKANTWNTLVLPFSLSASELKAAFGNDVKMAEFSEIPNDEVEGQSTINFQTMQEPKLMANTPVLLKTSVAGDSYTFEGRTLVATNEAVKAGAKYFDFVGSYQAETTIGEGNYFISSDKLYQAVSNTKPLKSTRAFIKAREEAQNARVVAFSIDGIETTAIDGLTMQGDDSQEKIFNLNGQQVEKARRGIYVKNGKKVVIR